MNKAKTDLSGFIAIDKPAGISSFDVIRRLRKVTGIRKIGHSGTLDPFATGLLVCCIGSYTRLAKFVESESKTYFATIQLGGRTETGDTEGSVIQTAEVSIVPLDIDHLEHLALGLTELPVPAYSAIKLDGKRAYALARAGTEMEMPVRPTEIRSFKVILGNDGEAVNTEIQLSYRCIVSKGTYIRSLSEWIAQQIGTLGYTIMLRREAIGDIDISMAVALETLCTENWQQYLLSPGLVLGRFTSLELDIEQAKLVDNGGDISLPTDFVSKCSTCTLYDAHGNLLAIGEANNSTIHPIIVLK
ncbi:MAG: tRNA pseudouridine(55) synthase TruB [Candidatus Cloacimonetes bacterium HGW-Cloacimonetes-3]|jgi:tRNA pseudouridine55 synthase|nr:MAG: tRNA pseudouridine(55) synthase TruB [Candidatus Cloacimonetes bacterium HGW-Cloacimonetes-3]